MRKLIVMIVLIATLIIAGCVQDEEQPAPETDIITAENLDEETSEDDEMDIANNGDETLSKDHEVLIEDFKFKPDTLQISVGDTVTWINLDSAPHTATSNEEGFDSGRLSKDESFSFTFEEAETFDYICTFHPYMEGEVIVKA